MKKSGIRFKNSKYIILLFIAPIIAISLLGINTKFVAYANNLDEHKSEIYYADNGSEDFIYSFEQIEFSTKTDDIIYINESFPEYYNTNSSLNNACANVAGSIIIGYYDRYYDLIPNCLVGAVRGGNYFYFPMIVNTSAVQNVINILYEKMDTNVINIGTTQEQYKAGLINYVDSRNRVVDFESVLTGNSLDMEKLDEAITNQRPVSLFLSGYNLCDISESATEYSIDKYVSSGNHIMIAYGYRIIRYFDDAGNNFRTDIFLLVSSGHSSRNSGWYYIGESNTTLNAAESAYIY